MSKKADDPESKVTLEDLENDSDRGSNIQEDKKSNKVPSLSFDIEEGGAPKATKVESDDDSYEICENVVPPTKPKSIKFPSL
jgi:hypothetical protein